MPCEARLCSFCPVWQWLVAQPQLECYLACTGCVTSVCAQHAGFYVQIGQSAKSFADDLALGRGVVPSRAVSYCDLLRHSPLTGWFVFMPFIGSKRRFLSALANYGRPFGILFYMFFYKFLAIPLLLSLKIYIFLMFLYFSLNMCPAAIPLHHFITFNLSECLYI